MTFQIRNIRTEEWEDAMALVWRTFLKYEACDYEEEGVRSFLDFIIRSGLRTRTGCAQKKGFPTHRWSGLSHLLQEIRQIRQHV